MSEELKSCPFCGAPPWEGLPVDSKGIRIPKWEIHCAGCEIAIRRPETIMARKDWNSRSTDTAELPRLREALEQIAYGEHMLSACASRFANSRTGEPFACDCAVSVARAALNRKG